jgi:hypothetical protein
MSKLSRTYNTWELKEIYQESGGSRRDAMFEKELW